MIFDRFRRKKENVDDEELYGGYAPLVDGSRPQRAAYVPQRNQTTQNASVQRASAQKSSVQKVSAQSAIQEGTSRRHIVELCEDIIEASRELETARNEYRQLTVRLNDVATLEGMTEEQKGLIRDTIQQIKTLDAARSEILESDKKMPDSQYAQMQEEEAAIPGSVRQLKSNEAYLDAIKRDINLLEGEKVEWSILRQECVHEQVVLRRMAVFLIAFFSFALLILLSIRMYMDYDFQLFLLLAAFITVLIGVYVLLKYQDCTREIKQCDVNRNQAIVLQNRVKAKYVNIKNAIDYTCDKYHVKNSYELTNMYEQFQSTAKETAKFRQTSDDLTFYSNHLVHLLDQLDLSDSVYWSHCMELLTDDKELLAKKTELLTRKQKLRRGIDESLRNIDKMKHEVTESTKYMGEVSVQVQTILKKIDDLSQPIQG